MSGLLGLLATGAGTPIDPEPDVYPVGTFPWDEPANLVIDGNSIYDNVYTSIGAFSNHIWLEEPFASATGITRYDTALSGQTWIQMTNALGDVHSHYIEGVRNVLFAAEGTNTLFFGSETSVSNVISQITSYVANVRAVHPDWLILLGGSLPAKWTSDLSDQLTRNQRMIDVDNHMKANYEAMGADMYVGFRDLPPFVGNGVSTTPYASFPECWYDTVHPNDVGKVYMRERVVQGLLALPDAH